jgi:hypothetical protein
MEWKQGTVYMRHTNKEGKSHISDHPCWQMDLFIAARQKEAQEEGGRVEVVTRADYIAARERARSS